MKFVILFLVAVASAIPIPDDPDVRSVDMMINGIYESEPFEMSHVFDRHLKENYIGENMGSNNLLFPYSVQGMAEAAAIAAAENEVAEAEESAPTPELNPDPLFELEEDVLSEPKHPEGNTIPDVKSEYIASVFEPATLEIENNKPVSSPQKPNREINNNDAASVTMNDSGYEGLLTTLQSWINMAINYISSARTRIFSIQ